jgi:hypothetical protein
VDGRGKPAKKRKHSNDTNFFRLREQPEAIKPTKNEPSLQRLHKSQTSFGGCRSKQVTKERALKASDAIFTIDHLTDFDTPCISIPSAYIHPNLARGQSVEKN